VETLGGFWELAFTGTKQSPRAAELALFSRLNRYGLLLEIERRQGLKLRARGPQREQAQQLAFLSPPAGQHRSSSNSAVKPSSSSGYYWSGSSTRPCLP
jgi:hypothetical protein